MKKRRRTRCNPAAARMLLGSVAEKGETFTRTALADALKAKGMRDAKTWVPDMIRDLVKGGDIQEISRGVFMVGKVSKNPVDIHGDPITILDFAHEIMDEVRKRAGRSWQEQFSLAWGIKKGSIMIMSARKIGRSRMKYVDVTPGAGDNVKLTGYFGSESRRRMLGYPKSIETKSPLQAANYLSTVHAIRHAPGAMRR